MLRDTKQEVTSCHPTILFDFKSEIPEDLMVIVKSLLNLVTFKRCRSLIYMLQHDILDD